MQQKFTKVKVDTNFENFIRKNQMGKFYLLI